MPKTSTRTAASAKKAEQRREAMISRSSEEEVAGAFAGGARVGTRRMPVDAESEWKFGFETFL